MKAHFNSRAGHINISLGGNAPAIVFCKDKINSIHADYCSVKKKNCKSEKNKSGKSAGFYAYRMFFIFLFSLFFLQM